MFIPEVTSLDKKSYQFWLQKLPQKLPFLYQKLPVLIKKVTSFDCKSYLFDDPKSYRFEKRSFSWWIPGGLLAR